MDIKWEDLEILKDLVNDKELAESKIVVKSEKVFKEGRTVKFKKGNSIVDGVVVGFFPLGDSRIQIKNTKTGKVYWVDLHTILTGYIS